ncbi:MAG: tail fiber domain-containing protein [Candidatus Omnitrophota bacterium]|nr:tail fiber domain-containing protein [Candidatus Omnitrophota bacterium]MDZ4242048.1 tail fiber domain-containing protein [Candidatus Omnitrophota bacterium]
MKRIILPLLFFVLSCSGVEAGQFKATTYYPAPSGAYDRVRFAPRATLPAGDCNASTIGTIYYDITSQRIISCVSNGVTQEWNSLQGVWKEFSNNITLSDTANPGLKKVAVGTQTPEFMLTLDTDGGIIAKGTKSSGNTLSTAGAGTRFIWYPYKAALRAGEVSGDQWNNANIGDYTIVFGQDNQALPMWSAILSGQGNQTNRFGTWTGDFGAFSVIAGGWQNVSNGSQNFIGSGARNVINADYSVISGGTDHLIGDGVSGNYYAVIAGGLENKVTAFGSAISGGSRNTIASGSSSSTIAGGAQNIITGGTNFIGGGAYNTIDGGLSSVAGGAGNNVAAGASYATIGSCGPESANLFLGQITNPCVASGSYTVIAGGRYNLASKGHATVSGGYHNFAQGSHAAIGGGEENTVATPDPVEPDWEGSGTIAGGNLNSVTRGFATIGGGKSNTASHMYATISGGLSNIASGNASTVSGGQGSQATGSWSTVGGGDFNFATAMYATVAGGNNSQARANYATIGGGQENDASGEASTIAGGSVNIASGDYSTVAGGGPQVAPVSINATASGAYSSVGGGQGNVASGDNSTVAGGRANVSSGAYASVPGGQNNIAGADYAWAGGRYMQTNNLATGTFVWGNSGAAPGTPINTPNTFFIFPYGNAGSVAINTANPAGFNLAVNGTAANPTGTWSLLSDERLKTNIQPLRGSLEKVLSLRGVSFEWKDPAEHGNHTEMQRGFIAQEVEPVFPEWVGTNADGFKYVEPAGINAVVVEAIKELNAKMEELKAENQRLQERIKALENK